MLAVAWVTFSLKIRLPHVALSLQTKKLAVTYLKQKTTQIN
jgi:hypothetical protein